MILPLVNMASLTKSFIIVENRIYYLHFSNKLKQSWFDKRYNLVTTRKLLQSVTLTYPEVQVNGIVPNCAIHRI